MTSLKLPFVSFPFPTNTARVIRVSTGYFAKMASESRVENPLFHPFLFLYQIWQWLVDIILSPRPPEPHQRLGRPKIAIIGAGITGVTSASHCIGHGFDVVIFEAGGEDNLGGIWSVSGIC